MKRVLVVTHAGGSPQHGPNMRWYYLGQALRSHGIEVEIVSSSSFHKYTSPPKVHRRFETQEVNGMKYHWLKTRAYRHRGLTQVLNQFEFVVRCYQAVSILTVRKPDVVIASSPHPLVNFPARFIARKAGARFFFEVRDLWPEVLLELGNFGRWHPYIIMLKAAERYGVRHAERVFSVKPGDGDYFAREYGLPKERFNYVPNGFLPGESGAAAPEKIDRLRGRYTFLLGYVGALSAYYRLENLLELAQQFQHRGDVGFVVVGKGELEETLRIKAEKVGLKNCHVVGAVPKSEVFATLECFDACYVGLADLAVHEYGISCNKLYEYMYASKPIIGSYRAGYDPVTSASCGFVAPPGHYESLVQGIESLIADPDMKAKMGLKAREYFKEHHDFEIVGRRVKSLLFPEEIETRDN